MNIYKVVISGFFLAQLSTMAQAMNCPDPQTTSLQWGVPPEPWVENPFSPTKPQGEEGTRFVRANILLVGHYGRGVVCTYQNSVGEYSIWWEVLTKIPDRIDYNWIDVPSGYICSQELSQCQFYVNG